MTNLQTTLATGVSTTESLGLGALAPEIFLTLAACVLLIMDLFADRDERGMLSYAVGGFALLLTAALVIFRPYGTDQIHLAMNGMFILDSPWPESSSALKVSATKRIKLGLDSTSF